MPVQGWASPHPIHQAHLASVDHRRCAWPVAPGIFKKELTSKYIPKATKESRKDEKNAGAIRTARKQDGINSRKLLDIETKFMKIIEAEKSERQRNEQKLNAELKAMKKDL